MELRSTAYDRQSREPAALTPEAVRNQVFTTVRLREGYDMGEVDAFLGEVEAGVLALWREIDALRAELERASHAAQDALADAGGVRAERVIAMAQQIADQTVAEAVGRAREIVGDAEGKAAAVQRQAREEALAIRREIGQLHEFAADFRSRLRASFESQLRAIEEQVRRLAADQSWAGGGVADAAMGGDGCPAGRP